MGDVHTVGTTAPVAEDFAGAFPDWAEVTEYTTPLPFPGVPEWSDLAGDDHDRSKAIRNAETTPWKRCENDQSIVE